jgi:cobalamin biosynthesis protein CobD/CbiB
VLYPLALRAARSWEYVRGAPTSWDDSYSADGLDFGWFAARAFHAIDWVPQRVSAFVFAVADNFEDALFCWRSQAAQWARPEEGIVLASGAGALGVILGGTLPVLAGEPEYRPTVGLGEVAGADLLPSAVALGWRTLILWLLLILLLTLAYVAP